MVQQTIEINAPIDKVWEELISFMEKSPGSIDNQNDRLKRVTFSGGFFTSFTKIAFQLSQKDPENTVMTMTGHAMEGLIKVGYAEKLMDEFAYEIPNRLLPEKEQQEYVEDNSHWLFIILFIALLVALYLFIIVF